MKYALEAHPWLQILAALILVTALALVIEGCPTVAKDRSNVIASNME
jgi:hypothetical protein